MPLGSSIYRTSNLLGDLTEEEERSLLGGAMDTGVGFLGFLGATLDTPASMLRNTLAGERPWKGLVNPEERTYGEDLFKQWGIDTHGGWLGEIGLEILLDPLTYMSGGLSAVGRTNKATKALVKSGALGKIGDLTAMSRSKGLDVLSTVRREAIETARKGGIDNIPEAMLQNQDGWLTRFAKGDDAAIRDLIGHPDPDVADAMVDGLKADITSKFDGLAELDKNNLGHWIETGLGAEAGKPGSLMGHRQLRSVMTPDDVLKYEPTGDGRLGFLEQLKRDGNAVLPPDPMPGAPAHGAWSNIKMSDEVAASMNQPLGKHLHVPLVGGVNIPGSKYIPGTTKFQDSAGQFMRWNPLGRLGAAGFGAAHRGAKSAYGQMVAPAMFQAQEAARDRAQKTIQQLSTELTEYSKIDQGFSGNVTKRRADGSMPDVMRGWFENATNPDLKSRMIKKFKLNDVDVEMLEKHRKLVRTTLDQSFDEMVDAGFDVVRLRDDFTAYHPRRFIQQAFKNNGIDLDVDLVQDFLKDVGQVEKRTGVFRNIEGGSLVINQIMRDPTLNGIMKHIDKINEDIASGVLDSVHGRKLFHFQTRAYENHIWSKYGHAFKNTEIKSGNVPKWWAPKRNSGVNPAHAKQFSDHIFGLSPAQRSRGFAHDPIADLEFGLEAAADAVTANRTAMDLIGRHAKPVQFSRAQRALGDIPGASTYVRGETQAAELVAQEGFTTIGKVLDDLKIRTEIFDESGRLRSLPGDELTAVSQKHLVRIRDMILERFGRGTDALGKDFVDADDLNDFLKSFEIPLDVARDLKNMQNIYTRPPKTWMGQLWDGYMTVMKTHLTSPFAAFSGRNWLSGQVRNMIIGLWSRESVKMSHQLMTGAIVDGSAKLKGIADELTARGMKHTDAEATKLLREKAQVYELMPKQTYGLDPVNSRITRGGNLEFVEGLAPIEKSPEFTAIKSPFNFDIMKMWLGADEAAKVQRQARRKQKGFAGWTFPGREFFQVQGGFQLGEKGRRFEGMSRHYETKFGPARAGEWLNQWVEGSNRISPFIEGLRKGVDEAALSKRIAGAQVDYGDRAFTRFEKAWMQRIFPFYKFRAGQMRFLPTEIAERPGGAIPKIIRSIETMRGRNEWIPEYLKEGTAVRTDDSPLADMIPGMKPDDPDTHRYLSGFGFMFEEPMGMMPAPGDLMQGPLRNILSSSHPAFKGIIEKAQDRSLFQGGRSLSDVGSTARDLAQNIRGIPRSERHLPENQLDKPPELLDTLLRMGPLSRYLSTARMATEPLAGGKGDIMPTIARLLAGIKATDVRHGTRAAIKQKGVEKLIGDIGSRFEKVHVSDDALFELAQRDPAQARKIHMLNLMLQDMAKDAKRRSIERQGGKAAYDLSRKEKRVIMDALKQRLLENREL